MDIFRPLSMMMFLAALVHLSAQRSVQDVRQELKFNLTDHGKDPYIIEKFGSWADRFNITMVPNPLYYDKPFTAYAEGYIYEDLVFGTIEVNIVQLDGPWSFSFSDHLCGPSVGCPWHRGEIKTFRETLPAPSTAIDKGTYSFNASVYNEGLELIVGVRIQNIYFA